MTVNVALEEKEKLLKFYEALDTKMLRAGFEAISMMVRAFEGQPIEPEDIISKLTNVKNILERSRFPTYPLLAKQVYLRLIALYNPSAYSCIDWANLEAESLISYKGLSREEWVDMSKSVVPTEQQQFYFGAMKTEQLQQPQVKRHFWQRKPKQKEESEFEHE